MSTPTLSPEEVRKVARLSRLAMSGEQVEAYRTRLSAVLGYVARLRELDLAGVEPMPHVGEDVNRLDPDEPGPMLGNDVLMRLAPDSMPPFVKVPKVFDDEGGA